MKLSKILATFILSFSLLHASSQRVYFVYVQTENQQPFFVKLNEKVYSSTPGGYLILSKLRDTSYNISVGFPGNKWPEQKFTIYVNRKDHGYLLRDFNEKGWGLIDLQSASIQMPVSGNSSLKPDFAILRTTADPFTTMLAKAADDPTLLQERVKKLQEKEPVQDVVVAKKEDVQEQAPQKPDTKTTDIVSSRETSGKVEEVKEKSTVDIPRQIVQDTLKSSGAVEKKEDVKINTLQKEASKTEEIKSSLPDNEIVTTEPYKKSKITRRSESSTTEGFGLVFIDQYPDGKRDTIKILIADQENSSQPNKTSTEPVQERKFLDITTDSKSSQEISGATNQKTAEDKPIQKASGNTCSRMATESDFLKLRMRMAAETKEEKMVDEAKKYFKSKCFTTGQIKNLSFLFLTNSGKYNFFEQAYLHVSDIENFQWLGSEIKDEYYINKFKAILK